MCDIHAYTHVFVSTRIVEGFCDLAGHHRMGMYRIAGLPPTPIDVAFSRAVARALDQLQRFATLAAPETGELVQLSYSIGPTYPTFKVSDPKQTTPSNGGDAPCSTGVAQGLVRWEAQNMHFCPCPAGKLMRSFVTFLAKRPTMYQGP